MRLNETAAALLYLFSKSDVKTARPFREVCRVADADTGVVMKYTEKLVMEAGLKLPERRPEDYLLLYGSGLNVPRETLYRGASLLRVYRDAAVPSNNPRTLAASALYIAAKEDRLRFTQKELAERFGIAEYTVREVSVKMKATLERVRE